MHRLDAFDRKLLQALQLDGRASFSKIAHVLGVSDQTVARRFRWLREAGDLRVIGMADEGRLGGSVWAIRLHCTPNSAQQLAKALAERTDTSYVALISGGTEVTCIMRPRSKQERDELLLDRLQRTPRVTSISAHCLLQFFYGGPFGGLNKISALGPEEEAALLPDLAEEPDSEPVAVSDADQALLAVLRRDGRASIGELRNASGLSEDTVRRRLAHLRGRGVLYFDVQYRSELLGQEVTAILWLTAAPGALSEVGAAMAEHPEVNVAAAVTGPANVFAAVVCRDNRSLYTYLSEKIGPLPGVQAVETVLVLRQVKLLALEPGRR